jgi:hypothetical protein
LGGIIHAFISAAIHERKKAEASHPMRPDIPAGSSRFASSRAAMAIGRPRSRRHWRAPPPWGGGRRVLRAV